MTLNHDGRIELFLPESEFVAMLAGPLGTQFTDDDYPRLRHRLEHANRATLATLLDEYDPAGSLPRDESKAATAARLAARIVHRAVKGSSTLQRQWARQASA